MFEWLNSKTPRQGKYFCSNMCERWPEELFNIKENTGKQCSDLRINDLSFAYYMLPDKHNLTLISP